MKLIVEMEMPKDCPMCLMAHYDKLDEFTGCEAAPHKKYAVKTDKAYAESTCRPSWCPIIGVLPEWHGDLIDRDELLKRKGNCYDADGHLLYAVGTGEILQINSIIAAERKDDDKAGSNTPS